MTEPQFLDRIEQRLNESGTGEMGLLDTIHAVAAIVREARTSGHAPTPAVTDEMAMAGARAMVLLGQDHKDRGEHLPSRLQEARACLKAALTDTSTDRKEP